MRNLVSGEDFFIYKTVLYLRLTVKLHLGGCAEASTSRVERIFLFIKLYFISV